MPLENEIETHALTPFFPPKASTLVLGTFPTHGRNWKFNFYYPGRSNFFWRILGDVYGYTYQHNTGDVAAEERKQLCIKHGIALSDTVLSCKRIVATSSKDSDLEICEMMPLVNMLREHKNIDTIILTSSSGEVSAHHLFYKHLAQQHIPYLVAETKPPIHGNFTLDGRLINVYTLYSPSGINIGRYSIALEMFRKYLPR